MLQSRLFSLPADKKKVGKWFFPLSGSNFRSRYVRPLVVVVGSFATSLSLIVVRATAARRRNRSRQRNWFCSSIKMFPRNDFWGLLGTWPVPSPGGWCANLNVCGQCVAVWDSTVTMTKMMWRLLWLLEYYESSQRDYLLKRALFVDVFLVNQRLGLCGSFDYSI